MSAPRVSPFRAGLRRRCPRCGEGRLYERYLVLAERCTACGLDYREADSGDGPAFFIILALGALVTLGALLLEVAFSPPQWVHMAIWIPAILGGSLAMLPPFKATLIALQYRHKAGEGRIDADD